MKLRVLNEQPHGRVDGPIPEELSFLDGDGVDWGLEDLYREEKHLQKEMEREMRLGGGVRLTGTPYVLRNFRIEPATGREPELKPNWPEAVYVTVGNDFSWVGEIVNAARVPMSVREQMKKVDGGWVNADTLAAL